MVSKAQPQSTAKQKNIYTVTVFNMECKGLIWLKSGKILLVGIRVGCVIWLHRLSAILCKSNH